MSDYPLRSYPLSDPRFDLHLEWHDPSVYGREAGAEMPQPWLDMEAGICWLHDPDDFTYLRESVVSVMSPSRRPHCPHPEGLLVAYAIIRPGGPRQLLRRRVWWIKPGDRDMNPDGPYRIGWPHEAVDPGSVRPRRISRFPLRERWGR